MQIIKAAIACFKDTVIDDVKIYPVVIEIYDDDYESEKYEGLEIEYFLFGETKTRLYRL